VLRDAIAAGRLSAGELEEGLEIAFGARDRAELAELVADLPLEPRRSRHARSPARRPPQQPERPALAAAAVLMVAIWALTGAGYFWPVWPILGWGVCVLGPRPGGGRRSGSRADTLRSCPPSASSTS
jgi:hypothetical protein